MTTEASEFDLEDPDKQWKACEDLGKVNDTCNREKAVITLVNQLTSKTCPTVKAHSVKSLGDLHAIESVTFIIDALETEKHRLIRAWSCDALAIFKLEKAIDPLIKSAVVDENGGVRAAAVKALKQICDDKSNETCVRAKAVLYDTSKREEQLKETSADPADRLAP